MSKIGENYRLALQAAEKIRKKRAIFLIINPSLNPETGEQDLLDVFVYNRKYDLIDWIYGLGDPKDDEIGISRYNYEWIKAFLDRYFNKYPHYIITDGLDHDFIKGERINISELKSIFVDESNILSIHNTCEKQSMRKIFDIYLLKVQQFLNFMDTDSIPLYFKNIAVIENELEDHKRAFFYLKAALKKNKEKEIRDELLLTLLKLEKYRLIRRLTENALKTKSEKQSRAFALKMLGQYKESLNIYNQIYTEFKEAWMKKDIRWLEDAIDKRV